MTSEPAVYNSALAPDLFSGQAGLSERIRRPQQNTLRVSRISEDEATWELTLRDFSAGGIGTPRGVLTPGGGDPWEVTNGYAITTAFDASYPNELFLVQGSRVASATDPTGNLAGIHHLNIFGGLIVGAGGGANVALYTENSVANGTLAIVTYSPGSAITGLHPVVIGGATAAQRMAVCRAGGAIQIHSDAAATVAGTMHANTNPGWGLIQTFISNDLILIYANASIQTLDKTSAIGDAPTAVLSNVPNGGSALGITRLRNGYYRAFWLWPLQNNTTGALTHGSEAFMKVMHTNLDGTDAQELSFRYLPRGVLGAVLLPGGVAAHDGRTVVIHDGELEDNLQALEKRIDYISADGADIDSDREYYIRALGMVGASLHVDIEYVDLTATANGIRYRERYNTITRTWHAWGAAASVSSVSATPLEVLPGGAGMVLSAQSRFAYLYMAASGDWTRARIPFPGENPFWRNREANGGEPTTGEFYLGGNGYFYTPLWEFAGYEHWPKTVNEIGYGGDLSSGEADMDITVLVRGSGATTSSLVVNATATFKVGDRPEKLYHRPSSGSPTKNIQVRFEIFDTVESKATKSPQLLPIVIRGTMRRPE